MPFSLRPDTLGQDPVTKQPKLLKRNRYFFNGNERKGIYYLPKENAYYLKPGEERCPDETLEKDFLPLLKWDYEIIKEETIKDPVTGKSGTYLSKISLKLRE